MSMMESISEHYRNMRENVRQYGQVSFLSAVVGAALMGGLWVKNYTPPERIASAPNRIIGPARDMAKGALNPDLLEVRVCDALPKEDGNELVLVYKENLFLGTEGSDGKSIVTQPYKGETWQCQRY